MRIDFKSFLKKAPVKPKGQVFPIGTRVYKGFQGSGKSLSMNKYIRDIRRAFPNCLVFSNLKLSDIDYFFIDNDEKLKLALSAQNGAEGVLIALDEAQLYFGKKTGISLDVFTAICQQRKDRRRLIFTSQIWEDLDVSLRKQVKEIVSCRCLFGSVMVNTIYDGETLRFDKLESAFIAKKIRTEVFKKTAFLCDTYDTYQKIVTNSAYSRLPSAASPSVVSVPQPPSRRRSGFMS